MKQFYIITIFLMLVFSTIAISQECVSCDNDTVAFINFASAVGKENTATGHASFAMGKKSKALGIASGAFGYNSEAYAAASFAIGRRIKSAATGAIVLGTGYQYTEYLSNGDANTLMIGFNSIAPTFIISKSPSSAQHTNRTGRVGIGVSDVDFLEAKLHIRSDDNEDDEATIFIEPYNWVAGEEAGLLIGNAYHGISANRNIGLRFHTQLYYTFNEGYVGINTLNPTYNLDVKGSIFTNQFTLFNEQSPPREGSILHCDEGGNAYWSDATGLYIWQLNENNEDIYYTTGNVSIGTEQAFSDYKLAVNGKIITEEVTVKIYDDWIWPDFVFGDNYQLESLKSVENYINTYNHLPGVPTAQEVIEEGINLGEMNAVLLQKIEELTLYTIEQQEMLEQQLEMMESQQKQINELSRLVNN